MKRKISYQLRLFGVAFLVIWSIVGLFAWGTYHQERKRRIAEIESRIMLSISNVSACHEEGRPPQPYLDFIDRYLQDSYLDKMGIMVFDTTTRELLYSSGTPHRGIPTEALDMERVARPDGSTYIALTDVEVGNGAERDKMLFYTSLITPDGKVEIRAYVPYSEELENEMTIDPWLWVLMFSVGVFGTILAYVITAHQARNVSLLTEFAERAASDRDFITTDGFPSDEIGEISRQIVSIYNSRMQANLRREREHEVALKAIEERNQLKRTLTDNLSHELKTPIGIIRAYVDMLLSEPDMPDADRRHFLEKVMQNVDRLVDMLNDLSTMTRLEGAQGKIPVKEIDFYKTLYHLTDDIEASHLTGDMDFGFDVPFNCKIMGNEGLLNSVLQNLVKNATNYSQGTEMGVEMIDENDDYYTFSFYDDGIGVDEEHQPHLFDRFFRIDAGRSRKSGGTGLGLAIVKSAINNMGGSISARTREGGGLEFVFTLPKAKPQESDDTKDSESQEDAPENKE